MLVSREILEFKARTQEETEGTLIGKGLATKATLRKLKAGESFIDPNGQRWWKYLNEWPLSSVLWPPPKNKWTYLSNPLPEEAQPQPDDAVLGGKEPQPRACDAVLGGQSE